MIDPVVLASERLQLDLKEFRSELRARYASKAAQVRADSMKRQASRMAETWLVEVYQNPAVAEAVSRDYLANLSIHFQRLLTYSEQATRRSKYDLETAAILRDFSQKLIIPLKQLRNQLRSGKSGTIGVPTVPANPVDETLEFTATAFVAHSFAPADRRIAAPIIDLLVALGFQVETGEKPRAGRISAKVKRLIDAQYLFVGVFTRREKIASKDEWTTSTWLVDEKAYAVAKSKKMLLIKEDTVGSIGGIQGDYEFIEFKRNDIGSLLASVTGVFELTLRGLKP